MDAHGEARLDHASRSFGQAMESSHPHVASMEGHAAAENEQHAVDPNQHLHGGLEGQQIDPGLLAPDAAAVQQPEQHLQGSELAAMQGLEGAAVGQGLTLNAGNEQADDQDPDGKGRFKPIDLEGLSPKSRQRVLRNRQAATKSKAKKKEQYTQLKDKKNSLTAEMEQLESQHAAAGQRVSQLMLENKTLIDSYKPKDELPPQAQ